VEEERDERGSSGGGSGIEEGRALVIGDG